MTTVNVHEAKTHLSKLLGRVMKGESIIIARNGLPVAELRPVRDKRAIRRLGELKGRIRMSADFNAPLPDDVLKSFEP